MSAAGTMIQHHTCQSCQGPCLQWRGSVWGFTCTACIRQHHEAQIARADVADRKARERLCRTLRTPKPHSSVR
ncbi:hypothetical protein MTY66_50800 [Mycolicibacterium sp. TY66]|nr:hypothetical protein MTY66_50800 [Mycolicibacterium sp. TY66]BCJ78901.1 hypothetical protein MTY81_02740 [Mycolicibacterium sp. TY81]